jgi:hypothetical protein
VRDGAPLKPKPCAITLLTPLPCAACRVVLCAVYRVCVCLDVIEVDEATRQTLAEVGGMYESALSFR